MAESLATLIHLVETIGLGVGFLLAFNAGRRLARHVHDARLVKRYGRRLPAGLGLLFYLLVLASLAVNIVTLAITKAIATLLKILVAGFTGGYAGVALSIGVTLAGLLAGYAVFTLRYRGVEEPLTREGRLALKGVKLASSVIEKVERTRRVVSEAKRLLPQPPKPPVNLGEVKGLLNRLLGEGGEEKDEERQRARR